MSILNVDTIKNRSGTEMYLAKAWVNFNGTGTVAIRASGNVSSITDNGTGDYTVNFTTAFADANYCVVISGGALNSSTDSVMNGSIYDNVAVPTTSALRVITADAAGGSARDYQRICVTVFR